MLFCYPAERLCLRRTAHPTAARLPRSLARLKRCTTWRLRYRLWMRPGRVQSASPSDIGPPANPVRRLACSAPPRASNRALARSLPQIDTRGSARLRGFPRPRQADTTSVPRRSWGLGPSPSRASGPDEIGPVHDPGWRPTETGGRPRRGFCRRPSRSCIKHPSYIPRWRRPCPRLLSIASRLPYIHPAETPSGLLRYRTRTPSSS